MEENKEEIKETIQKKESNASIIIIIILIILLLGTTGFIVYDKFIKKDSTGTVKEPKETSTPTPTASAEPKEEELSIESKQVKDLYELTIGLNHSADPRNKDPQYTSKELIIADLNTEDKLSLLATFLGKEDGVGEMLYGYYEPKYWNKDTVEKAYRKVFGNDAKIDLKVDNYYWYDYKEDGTLYLNLAGGESGPYDITFKKIKKAIKKDNVISLYMLITFVDEDENRYSDIERTKKIENEETEEANYKYVFKKDSKGQYYFYSIEKIK